MLLQTEREEERAGEQSVHHRARAAQARELASASRLAARPIASASESIEARGSAVLLLAEAGSSACVPNGFEASSSIGGGAAAD